MSSETLAAVRTSDCKRSSQEIDREFAMLIDGEWAPAASGKHFPCEDPFLEQSWGQIPLADETDVDRAVGVARRAFDEDGWPQTPAAQRARLLRRLAGLIEDNAEVLAYQQIRENGKLIGEMRVRGIIQRVPCRKSC